MKIDHVTVQVPMGNTELHQGYEHYLDEAEELLRMLGMRRVEVDPTYAKRNKQWHYRHYEDENHFRIHVVVRGADDPPAAAGLGHFRAIVLEPVFEIARQCKWIERDARSGRIWLQGPGTLRVEVIAQKSLTEWSHFKLDMDKPPLIVMEDDQSHLNRHLQILVRAQGIMEERDPAYGDSWKAYGWRGCLYNLRRKSERAWSALWNAESIQRHQDHKELDDLYDLINYAAMAIQCIEEGNRDGTFWRDI